MIPGYADHAANERTFLAWVRTGVAVIALGFVIEKFNIFLVTVDRTLPPGTISPARMQKLTGPLAHYGGFVLTLGGVSLIVFALIRFVQTKRRLAVAENRPEGIGGATLTILLATLLFVAGFSAYLALG